MNRLRGAACYLAGPMSACEDLGQGWRNVLTPYLRQMGVVVFDPTRKPIDIGREDEAARLRLEDARFRGDLGFVRERMKIIRRVDLRMVDLASFIIVRLDGSPTWGTTEEICVGIKQQKPVLIWLDGELSKQNVNPWVLSQVPLDHVFESMPELLYYLKGIDESPEHPTDRRWALFHFQELYRDVLYPHEALTGLESGPPNEELCAKQMVA